MATANGALADDLSPEIEGLAADVVESVIFVRVDQVDKGERLRAVDTVWADALGGVMSRDGQNTPIEVCRLPGSKRWLLVAGLHRLTGAEMHEIAYLKAIVVNADRASRRLREVSENLWRRDLDPIDRAAFMAELVTLKRAQAGLEVSAQRDASVHIGKRVAAEAGETLETISNVYGWTDEIGEQLGVTGRTIRNDLMIYRGVSPSVIAKLRDARHPVYRNATQLRALAKLDGREQARVADALLAGAAKSVSDAIAQTRGSNRAGDPEAKRLSAFIGQFQRMGLAEKKGALAELRPLLPAGFAIVSTEKPVPAVAIRASVKPDHLACLECGEKMERLMPHLSTQHSLSWVKYLARWDLPMDYPSVAPSLDDDGEEA